MIPVGWLFALERIAPGALLLLCVAWLAAMYGTRRLAVHAAQRLADSHQLTGEDRRNFLEWNERQQQLRATTMVFPAAVATWVVLLGLSFAVGVLPSPASSGAGRESPPAVADQMAAGLEDLTTLGERAAAGDPEAEFQLGSAYEGGIGVPADDAVALTWFLKAAAKGHRGAQFFAGQAYHQGIGTKQDIPEAIKWFEKAAAQGDEMAQFNLGATYEHEAAHKNLAKARYWYGKAAAQDYGHAKDALARLGK